MHLRGEGQVARVQPDRPGEPPAVLEDPRRVVADVETEIEGVVGRT
jgi:hypothetical protein